jgi:two-component system C4-dicarboxylate transport sensor histidine kinase DctB
MFCASFCVAMRSVVLYPARMKHSNWISRSLFGAIVVTASAGIWQIAASFSRHDAIEQLTNECEALAHQHSRLIDSELARFRLLPIVLGEYTDIAGALSSPLTETASRLSNKLNFLAQETGASILYLIAENGRVVSASNASNPDSFVGLDLGFRPYFKQAAKYGSSEYYGAGVATKRSGLFLARRVGDTGSSTGVVVVKYEFGELSKIWTNDPGETLIVDPKGVILAAPDASQVLTTLAPLTPEVAQQIKSSGQYGDFVLKAGRYAKAQSGTMSTAAGEDMIRADVPIAGTDLTLLHLIDTGPALRQARQRAWLLALPALFVFYILSAAVWWRVTRASRMAADRRELEAAVLSRTAQLRDEMIQRESADRRFREAREELAQANRLASLGSITAGLMHEINQPVATIRTLSENACHHLAANHLQRVKDNLDVTIEMAERIGTITQEMRRFSRRKQGEVGAEEIDAVIAGAMLLVEDRVRKTKVRLDLPPKGQPVILAERVRLEQVLVNLLQNALDAVEGSADPHIAIVAERTDIHLVLTIADNGPGIDQDLGKKIFLPFVTGKPEGLGLGLGIAQEIMTDLGGSLAIGNSPLGGAAFIVTVRLA